MIRGLRGLLRLGAVAWCVAWGGITLFRHRRNWSEAQLADAVQHWSKAMLQAMGVRVQWQGQPLDGPVLWVANHIAWLDILVLHSVRYARFIAKSEVHRWPLIGPMAAAAGTLFIERASRRDALRVVHQIAESLKSGDTVAVFPEGTTSLGDTVLPFHANLLQAAVTTQVPIQPVLIRYIDDQGARALHVQYVDDDSLLASLWRVLCTPETLVSVNWAQPQTALGRDRRTWSQDLRQVMLDLMQ